jgi:hypothetical protein
MKKVFGSHSEVAHIWAQQNQSEGRTSNVFFEGTKIYSYGYHYLAAQIHTVKGKRIALIRSDTYSNSTSKHLSRISGAVSGLMPSFRVRTVSNPKAAVKELDASADASITYELKRIKVTNKSDIDYSIDRINDAFREANELRKILGMVKRMPKKKDLKAVKDHLENRLKRYHELNTPEQAEKRELDREKRAARLAKQEENKLAESIQKFYAGTSPDRLNLQSLKYELLRVDADTLVTSRGAKVPMGTALTMYRALKAGRDISGKVIGFYTVNAVNELPDGDKVIVIGCHRVLFSEAQKALEFFTTKLQIVS